MKLGSIQRQLLPGMKAPKNTHSSSHVSAPMQVFTNTTISHVFGICFGNMQEVSEAKFHL